MKFYIKFFLIIIFKNIFIFRITENVNSEQKKIWRLQGGQSEKSTQDVNSSDAKAALEIWLTQFLKEKNIIPEISVNIYNDIDLIVQDINIRKIDYVTLNSLEFCRIKEKCSIDGFISGVQNGNTTKELVLVIRKGQIKNLKD